MFVVIIRVINYNNYRKFSERWEIASLKILGDKLEFWYLVTEKILIY